MNKYILTEEGIARFNRIKREGDTAIASMKGYEVLCYLYENGSGTMEEIEDATGLSWKEVRERLQNFIHHGYIEQPADL